MATILLVEDNRGISEGLKLLFDSAGHKLLIAENIKEATELIGQTGISLILLDVSLPDGNGFDFYKKTVVPKALATIFLTARDEEDDIIHGQRAFAWRGKKLLLRNLALLEGESTKDKL